MASKTTPRTRSAPARRPAKARVSDSYFELVGQFALIHIRDDDHLAEALVAGDEPGEDLPEDPAEDAPLPSLEATGSVGDLVRLYLREIGRVRLLTADEEVELARSVEVGLFAQEKLTVGVPEPRLRADLQQLVREGYRVRCLVRTRSDTSALEMLDVELVRGDLTSGESLIGEPLGENDSEGGLACRSRAGDDDERRQRVGQARRPRSAYGPPCSISTSTTPPSTPCCCRLRPEIISCCGRSARRLTSWAGVLACSRRSR